MTNLIEFYTIITERLKAAAYNLLMLPEEQRLIPKLEAIVEKEEATILRGRMRIAYSPRSLPNSGREIMEEVSRAYNLI
ncbi:MAG: hypothetical protein KKH88_01225 [Nanoarchaeota archaeon]|nr:hypothetical protein [Nanoarchaeota archaeon]MBU1445256.1 hypothetical protein [Nanoarchaeota archaeon]MBU2420731.1 hypothetical protein [Nanoarchaeota archaeon]MBU2475511.1 hypothetical protein [Nanoarchaeota archaeon]MBU3940529.1 hypothetical protein [Nanoarchaeota archaeon]